MELRTNALAPVRGDRSERSESRVSAEPVLTLALATSQALRALVGLKLARLGLSSGQDRLLIALADCDSMSVSGLADELNVRPSTVSKMMDRLAARGYTQRRPDTVDARRINVELTPEGEQLCLKLRDLWHDIDEELMAGLSREESARVLDGLTLLSEQIAQRLRRLR